MDIWITQWTTKLHVRINGVSVKEIDDWLRTQQLIKCWLTVQEEGHTHSILATDKLLGYNNQNLRKQLIKQFNLKGNGKYSISTIRNVKDATKYLMKETNEYYKEGIPDEFIQDMRLLSFKKDPKKKLMDELDELKLRYLKNNISIEEYGKDYVLLKVKYDQKLYGNHIKAHLKYLEIKKYPELAECFISDILR